MPIQEQCLYTYFVDCVKAFDRICQNCLWRKLEKLELSKKMRNTLQTIYKPATWRLKGANGNYQTLS